MKKRAEVYYEGRVQGVGFRYTAVDDALKFAVSGYVKNVFDGRGEVVVEGEEKDVQSFLDRLYNDMSRYISKLNINWMPDLGNMEGFTVKY
jgi:acylphosphatase